MFDCLTFVPVVHIYTMFILGMECSYMISSNPTSSHQCVFKVSSFKDALSQVVVEYDEEIPYDQDLAIRYSPFPIHQLCPLVVAHGVCKGPGAKI